ncbi:hypothetical protein PLICRDRAFT_174059 [Plicaturopsis crispa FD-325 SS-3]|nr:hypothetical protein PLICRDRAFT_174059 [Plicaturopsis crispa FD-325 SS-3]
MASRRERVAKTLQVLLENNLSVSELLLGLLEDKSFENHPSYRDVAESHDEIQAALLCSKKTAELALSWAHTTMKRKYTESVQELSDKGSGWHFGAINASAAELEAFRIEEMAKKMEGQAPELWDLLDTLLTARDKVSAREKRLDRDGDQVMHDASTDDDAGIPADEAALWAEVDDVTTETFDGATPQEQRQRRAPGVARRRILVRVRTVVVLNIMMNTTNQKCNAFQSMVGVFCHSCNTPERVIEALARMGVCISGNTIHNAITSLSNETRRTLAAMGRTLRVGYIYDNFDINFKRSMATVENSSDTLTHMTSGTLIVLEHGVTREHLRCSELLWQKSRLNPLLDASKLPAPHTAADLKKLHPEADHPSGLTRRERYNSWKFRHDLYSYGPAYFRRFKATLGEPETIEKIPVTKLQYAPAQAMDINEAKVSGQIDAIANLLHQGGVGDPTEESESTPWESELEDIREFVALFFGDLGTGERVKSLLERRSIEKTPWRRYQFVIFVMGLFHLKMACADALWRIFIEPKRAREDPNSLMQYLGLHRQKETGKIGSDPGFRRMHEVIGHDGIALRLDAWRTEVQKRKRATALPGDLAASTVTLTLDDFAATEPTVRQLEELADYLAVNYVAGGNDIYRLRSKPSAVRDQQHENVLLMQQYFLLYEEMSYAMNEGDIGRVETLFLPWIYIFKATGKHKYATHMTTFMTDVHFVYPKDLKHAIRYHMLVNPTGKPGKFRAPDWVEEKQNLDTKFVHGGKDSNYTKERVQKESTLIQIYRRCHENMAQNLGLAPPIAAHVQADITRTLMLLAAHLQRHEPNTHKPARGTAYSIPNVIDRGEHMLHAMGTGSAATEVDGEEEGERSVEVDDVAGEDI